MPSFNFFKKKKEKNEEKKNILTENKKEYKNTEYNTNQKNSITIENTIDVINKIEIEIFKKNEEKIKKIYNDTIQAYQSINVIAENIDSDQFNIEEEKLLPLIENTKRTITKALKRETSSLPPIPSNISEFIGFKEFVNTTINRFGEVTSSHSRIVNTFMKKHANNLRNELKNITENYKKINQIDTIISKDKEIVDKCNAKIDEIKNKSTEIKNNNNMLPVIDERIKNLQKNIATKKKQIEAIKLLPIYKKELNLLSERKKLEDKRNEAIEKIKEISSHLTKAMHKYSYGITKGTKEKIDILLDNPHKISKDKEVSEYIKILHDLNKSINSGKINLKDSKKVMHYCQVLIEEIPKFVKNIVHTEKEIKQLSENSSTVNLIKISQMEETVKEFEKNIATESFHLNELKDKISEDKKKIDELMENIESLLNIINDKNTK